MPCSTRAGTGWTGSCPQALRLRAAERVVLPGRRHAHCMPAADSGLSNPCSKPPQKPILAGVWQRFGWTTAPRAPGPRPESRVTAQFYWHAAPSPTAAASRCPDGLEPVRQMPPPIFGVTHVGGCPDTLLLFGHSSTPCANPTHWQQRTTWFLCCSHCTDNIFAPSFQPRSAEQRLACTEFALAPRTSQLPPSGRACLALSPNFTTMRSSRHRPQDGHCVRLKQANAIHHLCKTRRHGSQGGGCRRARRTFVPEPPFGRAQNYAATNPSANSGEEIPVQLGGGIRDLDPSRKTSTLLALRVIARAVEPRFSDDACIALRHRTCLSQVLHGSTAGWSSSRHEWRTCQEFEDWG